MERRIYRSHGTDYHGTCPRTLSSQQPLAHGHGSANLVKPHSRPYYQNNFLHAKHKLDIYNLLYEGENLEALTY